MVAHLYRHQPQAERFTEALQDPQIRSALASLQERFDAIDETASDDELHQLMAQAQSLVAGAADGLPPLTDDQMQVILDLAEHDLNDRQKDFMRIETEPPS